MRAAWLSVTDQVIVIECAAASQVYRIWFDGECVISIPMERQLIGEDAKLFASLLRTYSELIRKICAQK